ncbi:MAG TPA: SRPBCC domain-containing protein [Burkholderiales bacterium]
MPGPRQPCSPRPCACPAYESGGRRFGSRPAARRALVRVDADGDEHGIGHVLAYEPPARLVLSWEVSHDFKPDPSVQTEVEVTFSEESPTTTRVVLEHRGIEAYGEHAEEMRETFESGGGWGLLLDLYAEHAAK